MVKGIFISKLSPSYDDLPEERYHFPRTYLRTVEQLVGNQIVYYAPRRSTVEDSNRDGPQSYYASARVTRIDEDPNDPNLFYARVDNYLDFDTLVPWRTTGGSFEAALLKEDGATNKGQHGRSVRLLPDHEYEAILTAGFQKEPWEVSQEVRGGLAEESDEFERSMVQQTMMRPFRDQAFRRSVRQAYGHKCAITGIEIRNGFGRPEVEAAHIRPVEKDGPDSTRNGLALSGTVHWMFDRGLISIADDHKILVSSAGLPDKVQGLFNLDGKIRLPAESAHQPHPKFLRFHRENVFKG